MHAYWQSFLDFVFPRTCIVCRERGLLASEQYICTYCRSALPLTDYHRYLAQNPMYDRIGPLIPATGIFSLLLFATGGKTQKLLHAIKYQNEPELATMLGKWLGRRLKEEGLQHNWDIIVPVPLFSKKLKQRGYNQSAYFAIGLGSSLVVPVGENALTRQVATETQTKKSRIRRWKNVSSVFKITDAHMVGGKRVLLVDDVITTGATIASCGHAVLKAGARSVTLASIASA